MNICKSEIIPKWGQVVVKLQKFSTHFLIRKSFYDLQKLNSTRTSILRKSLRKWSRKNLCYWSGNSRELSKREIEMECKQMVFLPFIFDFLFIWEMRKKTVNWNHQTCDLFLSFSGTLANEERHKNMNANKM